MVFFMEIDISVSTHSLSQRVRDLISGCLLYSGLSDGSYELVAATISTVDVHVLRYRSGVLSRLRYRLYMNCDRPSRWSFVTRIDNSVGDQVFAFPRSSD